MSIELTAKTKLKAERESGVNAMMEELLSLIGDMESFSEVGDRLSSLIDEVHEKELDEDDLTLVSAASQPPPFREFLRRYDKK